MVNTDPATRGMRQLLRRNDEHFNVGVRGVGADGLIDWPRTRPRRWRIGEEAGQRAVARLLFTWAS